MYATFFSENLLIFFNYKEKFKKLKLYKINGLFN
jgi:hypothetical protein